jgi:hypothetical protein
MIRISLVGEHPTDTNSITNLLSKYSDRVQLSPLLYNIHGSMLDNQKTKRSVRREYELQSPDYVIFIRDLDSVKGRNDYEKKRRERSKYFAEYNRVVDKKGIFLLNIYELEALILADMGTFNAQYGTTLVFNTDPMLKEDPKGFLREESKGKYSQSDNPELFKLFDIEVVIEKCKYFRLFTNKLEKLISDV